ncbi:hypothetical protein F8388_009916 [Cannabis sativa]|uniref:Protein phosphatase n=1 Tax=Cannabis sativa TaxID=3483 RepID=A0A7J6H3J2_CANSA|nr:hypothetical protein F8388_009916 [Cannabis sativa]
MILEQAFMENVYSGIQGSSTACIIRLNNGILQAVNVGDSMFMVFRNNRCIYRSATQQKVFNTPYQLSNAKGCDTPRVAVEAKVEVEPGDVIILGTDGVWDNIFVWEMEQVLKDKTKNMDLKNLSILHRWQYFITLLTSFEKLLSQ